MDGGIGQCSNPECGQVEALTEDGFCSDECRTEVTGCSVPGCGCGGADDGVNRCTDCERYTAGVVDGRCPDCRLPPGTTTIEVAPAADSWPLARGVGDVGRASGARS